MLRKTCGNIIVLGLIAFVPAIVWGFLTPRPVSWDADALKEGEVRLADVLQSWEEILWIDARSESDFNKEHIPGAILLNEDRWDDLFMQFMASGRWRPGIKIVVYCGSSGCQASHAVAERLSKKSGIPNVWVLKGGWEAWKKK
jgi:rhodanese-related sulfurtransferase